MPSSAVLARDARSGPRPLTPAPDPVTSEVAELRVAVEGLKAEVARLRSEGVPVSLQDIELRPSTCLRQTIVATFGILVAGALLALPTIVVLVLAGLGAR